MKKVPCVYILTSRRNGPLYIGVTSNLVARCWQHKEKLAAGFTRRYAVNQLVHYELFETMNEAISREKKLKKWKRAWKVSLIEQHNPNWADLWDYIV